MAYLNLDLGFHRHPKVKRLVGLLGRGAEVLLTRLWCHCGEHHCVTGMLTGYSGQEIESIIEWWGKPGLAIEALVRVGFLTQDSDGYAVKDWLEHSGHLAAHKEWSRVSNKKRWDKHRAFVEGSPIGTPIRSPTGNPLQDSKLVSSKDSSKMEGPEKKPNEAEAAWLARLWMMHHKGGHSDHDRESAGNFEDLLADGVTVAAIEEEIKRTKRKKTEPIWVFCSRLTPKEKHGANTARPGNIALTPEIAGRKINRIVGKPDVYDATGAATSAQPIPGTGGHSERRT